MRGPAEGMDMTPPPSRPRAIRARSEGNSPRRHHRHKRHHRPRSRIRHDPQRGDVQNYKKPVGVPQQWAPAPSPPPVTTPPGDWRIAPDAAPFRNSTSPFVQPPPPRPATPHRRELPVRAKSAPVERARPASSSGSEVPPGVGFGSNTPPPGTWLSGKPATNSNVKSDAAPVTPPCNPPPVREPKAPPKKREKEKARPWTSFHRTPSGRGKIGG